jgi:probable phosphoglycerate mutase
LILVRHAHARSNERGCVSGAPPGEGLSERGVEQARAAAGLVAVHRPAVGAASRFARAQETLALVAPGVPAAVLRELDEIHFGGFEAGPLDDYRAWAWTAGPADPCPGGGESRAGAALRLADALRLLGARPEPVAVAVSHSMPIRYVLDAAAGLAPARRLEAVGHAAPHVLDAAALRRAEAVLRAWAAEPVFREALGADAPHGAS